MTNFDLFSESLSVPITPRQNTMRGEVNPQSSMFHYFPVDARIPVDHPLRLVKKRADSALSAISAELDGLYAKGGRPSIALE
jgi:hypothetical protein